MSLLPWRAAVLTLLALCGPAFAQSFDAQQAQIEASLDEALPLKTNEQRYEITRQGLAELMDLQETVVKEGWVSPRGWVLQCRPLGRYLRQWVDESQSLTRVYLGASWLEYWGVFCQPRQASSWSEADVRRLARATERAAQALPTEWRAVTPLYTYPKALAYFEALNRERTVAVPDRTCLRQAFEDARAGRGPVETMFATWTKVCPADPQRPPLEDGVLQEELIDTPLAAALASPVLGMDRWNVPARDLAGVLERKGSGVQIMVDMMRIQPLTFQQVLRQQVLLASLEKDATAEQRAAFSQELSKDVAVVESLEKQWGGRWPTPAECKDAAQALRQAAQATRNPEALNVLLHQISVTGLMCPGQAWSKEDWLWLVEAFRVTTQALPEGWGMARSQLGAPGHATRWLVDAQQRTERDRCIQDQVARAREEGEIQVMAWIQARARCQPAYQTTFVSTVEPFMGETK